MNSNYSNKIAHYFKNFSKTAIVHYFSNKSNYSKLSDTSLWLSGYQDIQSLFGEITSQFIEKNQSLMLDYLDCIHSDEPNSRFKDITRSYISFIVTEGYSIDREKLLTCLKHGDSITDRILFNHIKKNLKVKTNINLLGFGSDTCIYEKKLAKFILKNHLASNVTIYSYDPYSDRKTKDIFYIDEHDIRKNELKFDLMISRWVLHHVAEEFRWSKFSQFANACNMSALILVLEEGDLELHPNIHHSSQSSIHNASQSNVHNASQSNVHNASQSSVKNSSRYRVQNSSQTNVSNQSTQFLIYQFFLACIDIFVNFGLRPQWFLSSEPIGDNFYVNYLNHRDISNIENTFQFEYRKNIIPITDGHSYGQYILGYECLAPSSTKQILLS